MKQVFSALKKAIEKKENTVMATVVDSSGSAPRGAGARMLVGADGPLAGTVGGGAVEFRSEELGKDLLKKKQSGFKEYRLAPNEIEDLGMICGGDVDILFEYLPWDAKDLARIVDEVLAHLEQNQACWWISKPLKDQSGGFCFYSAETGLLGSEANDFDTGNLKRGIHQFQSLNGNFYTESLVQGGKVFIFGGGHVAQSLVPVLRSVGFYCVVYDDRPDFLTEEVFPTANERICGPLDDFSEHLNITSDDYGIVMTRGHKFDFEIEVQLLKRAPYYIGVMGSKRKVGTHMKKLQEEGFQLAQIKKMNMPIGLQIEAETPNELAISICGELIQKRVEKNQLS